MCKPSSVQGRVQKVLAGLRHVDEVDWSVAVKKCRGGSKVKIRPPRDNDGELRIAVFDGDAGFRCVLIPTKKPGAIARILSKRLRAEGLEVVHA